MNDRFYRADIVELREAKARVEGLEGNIYALECGIRDSYKMAQHALCHDATDMGEVMRQYGRMEAMKELMIIFEIEGI